MEGSVYMGTRKSFTLTDLSDDLGISIQTISKALRGLPGMSEETRSRIIRAAYLRGYLTVKQAREMVSQGITPYPTFRLRFVLVQSRESMNYNRLLTAGLTERFKQFDHLLENDVLDEDLSEEAFEAWIQKRNIRHADGLIIAPRLISSRMEQLLLALPLAKVLINYPKPLSQVDSVVWDIYEAICQSIDHLALNGHRRIMYVGDIRSQRGYVHRWQAFEEIMSELGMPPLWSSCSDLNINYMKYTPTAIVVGIDEDCEIVYRELERLGLCIPEDCSFVGLLNEQPLTLPTISRPLLLIKETGYHAADRILWRIAHPNLSFAHTRITGGFHIGDSVAKLI